ncbi:MAG: phosphonate ABC transporter, permease protein PhnE [Acidobacteriota bacterium]
MSTTPNLPNPPKRFGVATWVSFVLAGLFVWAVLGIEVEGDRLAGVPGKLADLAGLMWPPDAEYGQESVLPAILESIQIAWLGTMIGAALSLPFGLLGAKNLFPWLGTGVTVILAAIRAFPEILLAIYFVPIVGLGAFAGTLAVGFHSIGMLGKLSSDVVESMDTGPVEALTACGGSKIQTLRWAVIPQVLPEFVALWLYRFEINIRASAVLGVVGAGGIGGVLLQTLRYRRFDKAGAVIVLTVLVVLAIDALSSRIRHRLIHG